VAPFRIKVLDAIIILIAVPIFSFIGLSCLLWVLSPLDLLEKVFAICVVPTSHLLSFFVWGVLVGFLGFLSGRFLVASVDVVVSVKVGGLV
jgi:hypothetical protein